MSWCKRGRGEAAVTNPEPPGPLAQVYEIIVVAGITKGFTVQKQILELEETELRRMKTHRRKPHFLGICIVLRSLARVINNYTYISRWGRKRRPLTVVNGGQEAAAQKALELLIGLAGIELRFLRRQLVELVGCHGPKGEEVNDRNIGKLCEYAGRNPLRLSKGIHRGAIMSNSVNGSLRTCIKLMVAYLSSRTMAYIEVLTLDAFIISKWFVSIALSHRVTSKRVAVTGTSSKAMCNKSEQVLCGSGLIEMWRGGRKQAEDEPIVSDSRPANMIAVILNNFVGEVALSGGKTDKGDTDDIRTALNDLISNVT
ncbi:hypothetical protein Tco_1524707 [Tanacetum coccineum]